MARTLRQPPPHSRHGRGGCALCAGPIPPRSRTWCADCPTLWLIATSSEAARRHLVGLHGHACWECGADWRPGQRGPFSTRGQVHGGHPIRQVRGPSGGWRDAVPAPAGWVTGMYCDIHVDHGPPGPTPVELEVEHVRPLWSLTEAERDELRWWLPFNLQLLCQPCHRAKSKREAAQRARSRRGEPGQVGTPGQQMSLI